MSEEINDKILVKLTDATYFVTDAAFEELSKIGFFDWKSKNGRKLIQEANIEELRRNKLEK